MIDGHKIWFLTFADSRFNSWKRLAHEAGRLQWFDEIIAGDERLFEPWYIQKYKERFKDRGYGYWQWKSYLIHIVLNKMDENDILLYCDGGCSLNQEGEKRFFEYVQMALHSDSGVVLFDQGMNPKEWTKGDIFSFFNVNPNQLGQSQVAGGIIFLRKCSNAQTLISCLS